MTRTNIEIDDALVARVMKKYGLRTKKDAVDLALRRAAGPEVTPEFLAEFEGIGWDGDLDEIRTQPVAVVTLVDTSVWVEYLLGTGSAGHLELRRLRDADPTGIVSAEPIAMELLLGPTDEMPVRRIERLVDGLAMLDVAPHLDFRSAAAIFRAVRRSGGTLRSSTDCLIAAIAIRHDVPLLHQDADFEAIGEVTRLRHRSLRAPER